MNNALKIIYGLAVAAATTYAFLAPDAIGFPNPALARIIFFHLPCALGAPIFMCLGPYFAVRSLREPNSKWDVRALASTELAWLLGVLTLVTGSLFSRVQWGSWWNWDPRQTSFLITMLIVTAYFALRASFADPEKRAANSAAYLVASILPVLFLIFIFPRLPQVVSLHPDVLRKGKLDVHYTLGFLSLFALLMVFCGWLYKMRVRLGLLELELENRHARLADRDRPAASGVVRPVYVSTEDRS